MSSRDQTDDPLQVESEDDHMDDTVLPGNLLDILNDSNPSITDHTKQVPRGDEGVGEMETDQEEPETAKAEELKLQRGQRDPRASSYY